MNRVFIIAEAGVNHNNNIEVALKMVDVAVNAGADAIKFQTFKADKLVTKNARKAQYQIDNIGNDSPQHEMLKKLELSLDAHEKLSLYCANRNIIFMSTPFDEESADMLDGLGMRVFKIPSGEITNKPLIWHIASKGRPIILSTGMSYLGEVENTIGWIRRKWNEQKASNDLTLLHCVTDYPAAVEDSNLLAMETMRVAFKLPVGYSDHTTGLETALAAVALGASVIEKHFTLDKNMEGPDHKASLEPDDLRKLVMMIRNVEKALGDGIKRPVKGEEDNRMVVRKSLVAARDMRAGERFALDDICIKRPGTGLTPEMRDVVVGKQLVHDIKADSIIEWKDLFNA